MRGIRFIGMMMGLGLFAGLAVGAPFPPMQGRTNLALGKKVIFSPTPDYPLTAKGGTDGTDLTDGKTSTRADHAMWFESSAVGWSYPGRINLAVDLGNACDIDEIAIRLQNGSTSSGALTFPVWAEAFVSQDEKHYEKVGEFSRWNKGEFEKFGIGQESGRSYVDCLRFKDLKARGRWVGFRLYGTDFMVSDELYVFGKHTSAKDDTPTETPSGFTATHPQVYFHKPYLELATNVALPVPIGVDVPPEQNGAVTLKLELPEGVEIVGGNVGGVKVSDQSNKSQYTFSVQKTDTDKVFGRLYLRATGWKNGQQGQLRYNFGDGQWDSGQLSIPVKAVEVPAAPRLKKIMASLGWWDSTSVGWPDQLSILKTLGLNTFNEFGMWMPKDMKDPRWVMLEEARQQGFFISNIDSPLHPMLSQHKDASEIYDQFEDGTVGTNLCISYRGKYYQQEIERFAKMMAAMKPDFSSEDIELWGWAGPTDSVKCTRCQADFVKSGAGSWAQWQQAKGAEMIHDLITTARKAVKEAGGNPDFSTGGYDFRPDGVYQQLFDFNSLYPKLIQNSQVSTYTSLEPADIAHIGNKARQDRSRLPKGDVMPWNTPGDAGTFPGEAFQWSLLENYCNGARGIWFWSSRMWDSEDLIAYNKVIRAIAPVEDVIIDGSLVGTDAQVVGLGRVSGIKLDHHMVLLVADYFETAGGSVKLKLRTAGAATLTDLMTGERIGNEPDSGGIVTIPLAGQRARLIEVVGR